MLPQVGTYNAQPQQMIFQRDVHWVGLGGTHTPLPQNLSSCDDAVLEVEDRDGICDIEAARCRIFNSCMQIFQIFHFFMIVSLINMFLNNT